MENTRRYLAVVAWVMVGGLFVLARLATALPVTAETVMVGPTLTPTPVPLQGPIVNPSFETGDLTGWVAEDLDDPFLPLQVGPAGLRSWESFFTGAPTDGEYALYTGFDGCGPGVIRLMQDVTLPSGRPILLFDYRAAWDITWSDARLQPDNGSVIKNQDRHFYVVIEESGGGNELARFLILTAPGGEEVIPFDTAYTPTEPDTGNLLGTVDLSDFAGRGVRLVFEWEIPECFTGPAFFQLDNIRLAQGWQRPRSDVSVIIYGGWNGIPARAWVGGTEQETLYTAVNSFGDAQAMWTFYPDGVWPVVVDVALPPGLDPEQWELKLIRITSPTAGWTVEDPVNPSFSIVGGHQYNVVYQLISK